MIICCIINFKVFGESLKTPFFQKRVFINHPTPCFCLTFFKKKVNDFLFLFGRTKIIEVKSGKYDSNPPRAMLECMETLKLKKAVIFNKSVYDNRVIDGKTIIYAPYFFYGV